MKFPVKILKNPRIFIPILLAIFSCISTLLVVAQLGQSQTVKSFAQVTSPATKIMVVGDSISQGSAGDYTWRYRLWQHLKSKGALVDFVGPRDGVFEGATGNFDSTAYLVPSFDRQHDATAGRPIQDEKDFIAGYVANYAPDILLIDLGVNDVVRLDRTGQQAEEDMTTLINNARNVNPNIKIVISKLTPLVFADPADQTRWADYNNELVSLVKTLRTQEVPIVLIDPTPGFDPAVDTYDNIHPTPSGEYKIAAAFANALWNEFGIGGLYGPIPTAPVWPQQPTVTATPGNTQATLTWNAVPGAGGYYIYMRDVTVGGSLSRLLGPIIATTFTKTFLTNGHTYEFAVSTVRGNIGDSVKDPMSVPVRVTMPVTINFPPVADTFVNSLAPYTYYGVKTYFWVDGSPINNAYLKFDLRKLAGKTITSMILKIKSSDYSTTSSVYVKKITTKFDWTEGSTNYNNLPGTGSTIGTISPGGRTNTWFSVDVTSGLKSQAGQYASVALTETNSTGIKFYSRESSYDDPYLVVTYR